MTKLPTLYKRNTNGSIQQWTIIIDGDSYYTESGQVDGKITITDKTQCVTKNKGRSSETSPEEQAASEAHSKYTKQQKKGYTPNIDEVDEAAAKNFGVMLAHTYDDHKDKVVYPAIVQRKFDGIRCILRKTGAFTRHGEPINTVPHLIDAFKPVFDTYPNAIFDGELYNHELKEDFEKISSLVKKTKPSIEDLFESEEMVKYYVYDCPQIGPHDMSSNYINRMFNATAAINLHAKSTNPVVIVDFEACESEDHLRELHDKYVDEGYEGAMIRCDGPYEQKRSHKLLKVKIFDDEEFRLLELLPGRGNKANWAARAKFRTAAGDYFYAGILGDESYCKDLLVNADQYIGSLATVKFFRYTKAGIPRFPKMKTIRWDVSSEDYQD